MSAAAQIRRRHRFQHARRQRLISERRLKTLWGEMLEPRLMMAVDILDIVVGRTLSAYSVADVFNNRLDLSYTVYNEASEEIANVLVRSSLPAGVTLASASQPADQLGQELAWSLGTIPAHGRASVHLSVDLASPSILAVDTGVRAFGTLGSRTASDSAPPATLRADAIDFDLLASTIEANTNDPFIQEQAARLDYDPQQITEYLRDEVGYESYVGSLRGARGTLWAGAGNALDETSLGIALLRASGIPAQYVAGTLSDPLTQQLVATMFPAPAQTVGYLAPGTPLADPLHEPDLLAEAKQHYWIQFDAGGGWQDLDSTLPALPIGQAPTSVDAKFTEVDFLLRHRVQIELNAESYSQANAAFGFGDGLSTTTVLGQTFVASELVGRPLTLGHAVDESVTPSPVFVSRTISYHPYLAESDQAFESAPLHLLPGNAYQEVFTNFPFGSQLLTQLTLKVTTIAPTLSGIPSESTVVKVLHDRIGYAARHGSTTTSVSVDPNGERSLDQQDLVTLFVSSGAESQTPAYTTLREVHAIKANVGNGVDGDSPETLGLISRSATTLIHDNNSLIGWNYLAQTDAQDRQLEVGSLTQAYYHVPRIVAVTNQLRVPADANAAPEIRQGIDILRDTPRVLAFAGQAQTAAQTFSFVHGLAASIIEGNILRPVGAESGVVTQSAIDIYTAATAAGANVLYINANSLAWLDGVAISAEAKARITAAVTSGKFVLVPDRMIDLGNGPTIAWVEADRVTFDSILVAENGEHQSISEWVRLNAERIAFLTARVTNPYWAGMLAVIRQAEILERQLIREGSPNIELDLSIKLRSLIPVITDAADYEATAFASGYRLQFQRLVEYLGVDPPAGSMLYGVEDRRSNTSSARGLRAASLAAGTVSGNASAAQLLVSGQLQLATPISAVNSLSVAALDATNAIVKGDGGVTVGSGLIRLRVGATLKVRSTGTAQLTMSGTGDVSLYAPAAGPLAGSGDWTQYTGRATGAVEIELTTDGLQLNGMLLPAGTYRMSAALFDWGGQGTTSFPNFATGATLTAVQASVQVSPASGNLLVGGVSLPLQQGFTLGGYSGMIQALPAGNLDVLQFAGTANRVLALASVSTTASVAANGSLTLPVALQSSLTGTFAVDVAAPAGWSVSLGPNQQLTIAPPPGVQSGTFPIRVTARSESEAGLVAAADISVTVTPAVAGITLNVAADSQFTVPFSGAQVPAAFRATVRNLAATDDTLVLTFPNPPAGFAIRASTTFLVTPAGETGVAGIYLEPTGALPAPGTLIVFTVTATSLSNPLVIRSQIVNFTMPAVAAVGVELDPSALGTTPGTPVSGHVTIHNVGNVPYNLAIGATLPRGLAISGLTTPVALAVGQSTTQTMTLTPAAGTPLNTTLTATLVVGPAVSQNSAWVASVSLSDSHVEAGDIVQISASAALAVLQRQHGSAFFTVTNGMGTVVFTSPPVPVDLSSAPSAETLNLGTLNTSGFASGQYTIETTIRDASQAVLPSGTGTGALFVGVPVGVEQSVSPSVITEGTDLTYATGNAVIENRVALTTESLISLIGTDGTALSVALLGNLAYVAGTENITIVNLANPAAPTIAAEFGASDIRQGAANLVKIMGTNLFVSSQDTINANNGNLLVYSLANPLAPQLLSDVVIPYRFVNEIFVQGNMALLPTSGVSFTLPGNVVNQFGDLISVDLTNLASPAVSDVLFNSTGSPDGGPTAQSGGTLVTPQFAYIGSTTATGTSTDGDGRVLIVNIANPANLTLAGTLLIPGVDHVLDVEVSGNRALVVGASAGLRNPFDGFDDIGLDGNLTLTLLDTTDPLHPAILADTVVTSAIFGRGTKPGLLQVVALGDQQFVVSGTRKPEIGAALAVVDARQPTAIQTRFVPVPSMVNGISVSGDFLHVTSDTGLATYRLKSLLQIPAHVEVLVPTTSGATVDPTSFNIQPTQIVSRATFDTLVWDLSLDAATTVQELTWRTNIAGLLPGAARDITLGTTVSYTTAMGPTTVALPARTVVAVPASQELLLPVRVSVPGSDSLVSAQTSAAVLGLPEISARLGDLSAALASLVQDPTNAAAMSQSLAALDAIVLLTQADPFLQPLGAEFEAARTTLATATIPTQVQTAITGLATVLSHLEHVLQDVRSHGFEVGLVVNQRLAQPGTPIRFDVYLRNTGTQTTTFDFALEGLPAQFSAVFNTTSVTLAPDEAIGITGAVQQVFVTITPSGNTLVATGFTITATPREATELTQSTSGSLGLRNEFIGLAGVTLSTAFTPAMGTVEIAANVVSAVNEPTPVTVSYEVRNATDQVVRTSPEAAATLTVAATLTKVPLPALNATGLSDGSYVVVAIVKDELGQPIPGAAARTSLQIGTPLSSYLTIADRGGLNAEFFDFTDDLFFLPDLSGRTADVSRIDNTINYPSTGSPWPGLDNRFADTFAARHTGYLYVTTAGVYTLSLTSDDGSALWLDDQQLISNDGAHGMAEASSTQTLTAGYHPLRIEYFESGGGAGLIFAWSGPGFGKQVVPERALATQPTVIGSSATIPAGDRIVNNSLHIQSQSTFVNPLTIRGIVDTNGLANSVVTYGNVAYVSGSNDISIVDISDAQHPQVLSTFGVSLIVQNGFNISRIVGNLLIVGTTTTLNANGFNVLIYDLANPLSPSLLSNTPINYRFLTDFLTADSTVLATTNGIYFSFSGDVIDQFGDVVSLDITNPASPTVSDALFNNRGPLDGGDTWQPGGTFVDDHTAYIASSTSTGANVNVGTGRVLIVDTTNPANLALTSQILIPGTVMINDIAIQGNRALAVGSTAGIQNPFNGTNSGFTGNMSLTLLDTTDKLHPTIIGTSLVTNATFPRGDLVGKLDAVSLGNGLFGVSQAIVNGQPVLLLVDPSDPNNLIVSASPTAGTQNGIEVVGNKLYATSAAGLTIYDIGSLQSLPLTASMQVPKGTGVALVPGSFNVAPDQIVTGPTFDTLTWNRTLAFGTTSFDFTWQELVTGLVPAEQRNVTLATTITEGTPGNQSSLGLPPLVAIGQPTASVLSLSLTPPARMLRPGETTSFVVTVNNPASTDGTFSLTVAGVPAAWVTLPSSVQVPANGSAQIVLQLTTDPFTPLGDLGFSVIATSDTLQGFVLGNLDFTGSPINPDPNSHGVVAALSPTTATAGPRVPALYTVRVTNTGSSTETFNLSAVVPPNFDVFFEETTIEVPPGVNNYRDVMLQVIPFTTNSGTVPFTVNVQAATHPVVATQVTGTVDVVTAGVTAVLSPFFVFPGNTVQLYVQNQGSTTDTFDLTLAGPGALIASLAQSSITLAPGEQRFVTVNLAPINFAARPFLELNAIAVSRNNQLIKDLASAQIQIPITTGLSTRFQEDTLTLGAPGSGTFLLLIDNLGNEEELYEATILSTNGPVTGALIGPDGHPATTVPVLRIPGLTTAAIVLQASLSDIGQGTLTVQVHSLRNNLYSESTALLRTTTTDFGDAPDTYGTTLAADGPRHLATGPRLGANRDPEANGMPSTNALGDDALGEADDEDGVILPGLFVAGSCDCTGTGLGSQIIVNASGVGYLDAWIDFNRNGVFDATEKIANSIPVMAGANAINVSVPESANTGLSYARFRISSTGGLGPTGAANDGEIEDYAIQVFNPNLGTASLIADPNNAEASVLYIKGTPFSDAIVVRQTSPGVVTVYIAPQVSIGSYSLPSFRKIVVCGMAGADSIAIESPINKPTVLYGDEGPDAISGGSGPDIIFGGLGVDALAGNAGDDVISGGDDTNDSLVGGAGFDRLWEIGSGQFTLTSTQIKIGNDTNFIGQFEAATLVGGNASDSFNIGGWPFPVTIEGGGGTNTIVDSGDGNFMMTTSTLTRTIGAATRIATFTTIQNANLTGGTSNNTFNLSAWPFAATLTGAAGTDTFTVSGDVDYTLSDAMLLRPNLGLIRLSGFENATLTAGASDNTFTVSGWTKGGTLHGTGGSDKLISVANVNQSLSNTSLTRTGRGTLTLSSIEEAELAGGTGNNTLSAANFSGPVKLDGGGGNDTLTSGAGLALLLGGAGNDTLRAGTGRAVMIGGAGLDRLTGGTSDDLLISGQTAHDTSAAALALILAEWASAASYADRLAHLTGTPGGLNGNLRLDGSNVLHDTAVDILLGGLGNDLFFAKLTNPAKDALGDKAAGETAL